MTAGDRIVYKLKFNKKTNTDNNDVYLILLNYLEHDKQDRVTKDKDYSSIDLESLDFTELELHEWEEGDNNYLEEVETRGFAVVPTNIENFTADDENLHYEEFDVYLSKEQEYLLKSICKSPSKADLILAPAGTGKTILGLHIMAELSYGKDVAYFTLSRPLLELSRKRIKNIIDSSMDGYNRKIEFNDLNEYCCKMLKVDQRPFSYNGFKQNCSMLFNNDDKIGFKLWSEIRGRIKGSIGEDTFQDKSILQSSIKSESEGRLLKELEKNVYLKNSQTKKNRKRWRILDREKGKLSKEIIQKSPALATLANFSYELTEDLNQISGYRTNIKMFLSLEDYLQRQNSAEEKQRALNIYSAFEKYQKYLNNNIIMDDNDLARHSIAEIEKTHNYKGFFDLIVVDEVQDYTEVQILFLTKLLKDKGRIIFIGDLHQLIHASNFSETRLKQILKNHYNINVGTNRLEKNFRNQRYIVELANQLSLTRKKQSLVRMHSKGKKSILL